jgi:hypothetical protein
MSPEHCNSDPITKYSDIYSLGVTLWQMLTGKAPYEGLAQGPIFLKVANENLPSIQSIYQNVSLEMNEIVQKATHKKPEERHSSCDIFKKDIVKLKKHLENPTTELNDELTTIFLYNISIEIVNGIEAKIFLNEDYYYGKEFSKSFEDPTTVNIEVVRQGYKKIKQQLFLTKNEKLQFSLEKKTPSFYSILSEIQNKAVFYSNNIKPNLTNLFIFLKLNSLWAIESIKLKLKKNQPKAVLSIQQKKIETKKAILSSSETIKPHKKEYASYLLIVVLFTISLICMFGDDEEKTIIAVDKKNPKTFPIVSFENTEAKGMESQTSVEIPILLSEDSDSIIKIPLLFSGTASKKDFRISSDTVVVQANKKIGFIKLLVFDDKIVESNETIQIELQTNKNIILGEKQNYTYTIVNNDKKPVKKPKKVITTTVNKKPTPTQTTKSAEVTAYQNIRQTRTHDQYSNKFDDYFLLMRKNGKYNYISIFNYYTGEQMGDEYKIVDKKELTGESIIKNIYYKNHRLFTNKGNKLPARGHLIDIRNPSSSSIKGGKIRNGYLGDGTENKITLYKN